MECRIEVALRQQYPDPRGRAVAGKISRFLQLPVRAVRTREVYVVAADVSPAQVRKLARVVSNPVTQACRLDAADAACDWLIEVGFLPGVTDNVARTLRGALADLIGRELRPAEEVFSSVEYLLDAPDLPPADADRIARQLLANPLIHRIRVFDRQAAAAGKLPLNLPRIAGQPRTRVESFDLDVSDAQLLKLSEQRTLALTLEEMTAIQAHYRRHGAAADRAALGLPACPTDVELEALAQTWSEHCKHKIFDAVIDYTDEETAAHETIVSLFQSRIKRSTAAIAPRVNWLLSVFKDNAGVIAFNDQVDLVYKVETHNSPSALDPYGGAMTGIVGVNRDPMGTGQGANLLANVWGYCLAAPDTPPATVPAGLLHPRLIRDGVHQGVIEGGNQSGIPYVSGWEYFDERYLGKPLVFCGTIGTLPKKVHGVNGYDKSIAPGDLVVMAGGRIGKDGIHGATFSSEELHSDSPVQAVQIGDPITQKKLADFTLEARALGLYRFLTDNGAGGLSSSIGEMATICGGVRLDLTQAPLKYAGLQPWEILLSEAQERMSYAVPPANLDAFLALARRREVEATVLGEFNASGRFYVEYGGQTVAWLDLEFLHEGYPRLTLKARWRAPRHPEPPATVLADPGRAICELLGRLNLCSGESKARQYDHEVKGLSVIKPYVGLHNDVPADACVFTVEPLAREGVAVAAGILPRYSDLDTYHMAASVIDLALRRLVGAGVDLGHVAGLDNFCWPDPVESAKTPDGQFKLAQLVRANQALYDYTIAYGVPCISGKDSMKNDSTRGGRKISIPPTLLFSTIGRVPDVTKARTLDVKRADDLVYVLGETRDELGGSEHYARRGALGQRVPTVDAPRALALYRALAAAIQDELCHSVHTPALGGLAAAFARKAIGGRLGLDLDLDRVPGAAPLTLEAVLFSESNTRFVVTVPPAAAARFERALAGQPWARVGRVTAAPVLALRHGGRAVAAVPLADLLTAFRSGLDYD